MRKGAEYEKIIPLTKLHADEPFFMLRGQDKLSPEVVMEYSRLLERESWRVRGEGDEVRARSLSDQSTRVAIYAHQFMDWQEENPDKVKLPD